MRIASAPSALCLAALVLSLAACAARMPPAPAVPAHPDFVFPVVPGAFDAAGAVSQLERGWRYLQADDTARAGAAFESALSRRPDFFPARAAQGYVALATGRPRHALDVFDETLAQAADYAPALAGRGQALLALDRGSEASDAFEAALAADPSLTALEDRVAVLRLRVVQERIERARAAAAAGRLEEARQSYEAALAVSPDSAFLHRELGILESRSGDATRAIRHLRQAVALDGVDVASLMDIGRLLDAQQDVDGALAAYRQAFEIDPDGTTAARIAALEERARDAQLPAEFRAIAAVDQVSRGELAALVGVRFAQALASAPVRQTVMTDTRGHWAESWIRLVAGAGIMDPFDTYAFEPRAPVRRVDLADVARRLTLLLDSGRPELSLRPPDRPAIADVTPSHLSYPAVSFVVASDLMPLLEGQRFQVSRPVTGEEAMSVVERLRTFAAASR